MMCFEIIIFMQETEDDDMTEDYEDYDEARDDV